MLGFSGRPIIVCSAALVLCLFATGSSWAQGKSSGVIPPGAGAPSTSGAGAANTTTPSTSQSSEPQAGVQLPNGSNGAAVGVDGQLQTLYSLPLKDAWSLQLGAGVDPEQQSRSNPTGDINGRVGLGFKF
jgi:hypothetical protein